MKSKQFEPLKNLSIEKKNIQLESCLTNTLTQADIEGEYKSCGTQISIN